MIIRALKIAAAAAGCLSIVGCATLPDTDSLRERHAAQSARFEGALGQLSEKRSTAIVANLKQQSGDLDILDKQLSLEQDIVGSPLVVGNKVTLLQDGPATYQAMFAAIRTAKDHINVESYIIEDDEVGRQFSDLLLERQAQGVQVNLIYDSLGAFATPKTFFDRLREGGVRVLEFNPAVTKPWTLNNRDHRKLLVVDGRTAFLGGINISSVYGSTSVAMRRDHDDAALPFDTRPWRDLQTRIEGPVVADLERAFLGQWAGQKKQGDGAAGEDALPQPAPQGAQVVRVLEGAPSAQNVNAMYVTLISAIENAEKEVRIMNPYFVPHESLRNALQRAARRGVDVRLVLPSHSESRLAYHAGRSYYGELLEAGVRIFERNDRMLHAKAAIVDGVWSTVGSTNLDWRSLLYNDEINVVVIGPGFAKQMETVFDRDMAESREITPGTWRERSLQNRIKEFGARLWARLL
jgi:cardiolipin synthase